MSTPIGTILSFYGIGQLIPPGYRACDGTPFTVTDLPQLFALLVRSGNARLRLQNPWGPLTGAQLPSNTIRLPDLRGEFLRGFWTQVPNSEPGRPGNDPEAATRALGSHQADEFRSHSHVIPFSVKIYNPSVNDHQSRDRGPDTNIHSPSTSPSGGAETRPNNVALTWIIRVTGSREENPALWRLSVSELGLTPELAAQLQAAHPDLELLD